MIKKMRKWSALAVSLMLCLSMLVSCSDQLDPAPYKMSAQYTFGDSIKMDESCVKIKQDFSADPKKDGYISGADLSVDVMGYDADFTYFDATVTVIWTYVVITDSERTGHLEEHAVTIALNASGDGSYKHRLCLDGCRGIADVDVRYEWTGTATRL